MSLPSICVNQARCRLFVLDADKGVLWTRVACRPGSGKPKAPDDDTTTIHIPLAKGRLKQSRERRNG